MDEAIAQLLWQVVFAAKPLAALVIVVGGFCLIIGRRAWAGRLFLFAGFLIVVHVLGPGWLP